MTDMEVVKRLDKIINILSNRLPEHIEATLDWLDEPVPVPRPEPADITEEPPVGSQVTDCDDEVWGRFEEGWQVWDALGNMEWSGDSDPWSAVRNFAPLRPTTDEDRKRVGLPVEPAPADVDLDETLADVLIGMLRARSGFGSGQTLGVAYDLARAAREHIEAEGEHAAMALVREAETERDEWREVAGLYEDGRDKWIAAHDEMRDERDRHSRSADKWCNLYADKCEEIESVQAKADRYDALRADVEEYVGAMGDVSAFTQVQLLAVRNRLKSILAADDEMGR